MMPHIMNKKMTMMCCLQQIRYLKDLTLTALVGVITKLLEGEQKPITGTVAPE